MPERLSMPIGEAIFSQRAIRRLRPDPIGEDDQRVLVEAAQKAPNGGNEQPARFLLISEPESIRRFGKLYREAWWAKRADQGIHGPEDISPDNKVKMSAMKLADEMGEAPLIVLVCSVEIHQENSIYPAVQNLMLAARALGIGSNLTTLHPSVIERVHALFDIPKEAHIHCCIPLGYPRGNFGPTSRKPSREVAFLNHWGAAPDWN